MQRSGKSDHAIPPPPDEIETPPGDPRHQEELLDEAIQESFPASDPVSISIDTDADRKKRRR